jgi:hypothetical protein
LEMEPAEGFPAIPATERLDDHIRWLHLCTENTPWYRNPFEADGPQAAVVPMAGPSRHTEGGGSSEGLESGQRPERSYPGYRADGPVRPTGRFSPCKFPFFRTAFY